MPDAIITGPPSKVEKWKAWFDASGWWHSFELPGGEHIEGVCSVEGLRRRLEQFPIAEDLRGARVLDIGAWDGWYSFEMERRGAEVVAIDCWDNPRFRQIHRALNSRIDYREMDVYEVTPDTVGRFDIVLFFGVLYHLKHPLLALERVCSVTRDLAAVDSFVLREQHRPGQDVENRPVMEFYETTEFGGQTDNWCAPSLPCLMAMCRTAGFARVEHRATLTDGAGVACYRKWMPVSHTDRAAPELLEVAHHTNFGINFRSRYDEYVAIMFRTPDRKGEITRDELEPQVDEYGVRPIAISRRGTDAWQANFKLPPGLEPGWHEVTVRIDGGPASNACRIAVDIPVTESTLSIAAVSDGVTWEPGVLHAGNGSSLAVWVTGLPDHADKANLRASVAGEPLTILFVEGANGKPARQINVAAPADIPAGIYPLKIWLRQTGGSGSAAEAAGFTIEVRRQS